MISRRVRRVLIAIASTAAIALSPAAAATDGPAPDEIGHLLEFVAASSCAFVRNGTEYPADKARDHLAAKYRMVKDRIGTADDFIKHLATQSSMSGAPYRVKCGKTDALSGEWLNAELKRYRATPRLQHVSR